MDKEGNLIDTGLNLVDEEGKLLSAEFKRAFNKGKSCLDLNFSKSSCLNYSKYSCLSFSKDVSVHTSTEKEESPV